MTEDHGYPTDETWNEMAELEYWSMGIIEVQDGNICVPYTFKGVTEKGVTFEIGIYIDFYPDPDAHSPRSYVPDFIRRGNGPVDDRLSLDFDNWNEMIMWFGRLIKGEFD